MRRLAPSRCAARRRRMDSSLIPVHGARPGAPQAPLLHGDIPMIKRFLAFLFLAAAIPAFAQNASSASVERLLAITRTAAMIDAAYAQAQQMITQTMRQAAGPDVTPEQQARMEELTQRNMAT